MGDHAVNPLISKYLQEMLSGGAEMPPSWQQGASVQPEAPPSSGPDLMAYFKGLHPEMFSQDSIQTAQAEDARSNDARSAQRSFARAAAYMTRNAPDYAGLGPTDQAQRNLQARQQQAIASAEVGSKVGQFRSAADAADPRSETSRRASVRARALYGDEFSSLYPTGASANEVAAWEAAKAKAVGTKKDANQGDLYGAQRVKTDEEAATERETRPEVVRGKKLSADKTAVEIPLVQANTANTQADTRLKGTQADKNVAETAQVGVVAAPQQFDVDFTPPTIKAPDGVVNPIVAAAGDARASIEMIRELRALTAPGVPIAGGTKQRVDQLVTSLQMKLKNIYGLGVLNKSDMDLLDRVVKSPTGVVAWIQSGTGLRDFTRMLDGLETDTKTGLRARAKGIGATPKPGSVFAEDASSPAPEAKTPAAPPGATHYSRSTGKFYDDAGNEVK
jgi:hypothetical protein